MQGLAPLRARGATPLLVTLGRIEGALCVQDLGSAGPSAYAAGAGAQYALEALARYL